MTAFPWTDEQKAVLGSKARITLVQAGPGSGKTKVFAEIVDERLRGWTDRIGGLAALSFTNVARDEIADRVCAATVSPHFVGTLDAFFLRFVIGPFGHLAGLPKSGARLIPSPLDQQMQGVKIAVSDSIRPTIFQIAATGGTEDAPEFQYRIPNGFSAGSVPATVKGWALTEKRKEWKSRGRVTHGDCSYLASCILNGCHGLAVRAILARRFPVICIDEFQDTGHFLGRAVLALLAEPRVEALVVGDVDQKIFGFSGVNPQLFSRVEKLHGTKQYPLRISQRCAGRVCSVASSLSRSATQVLPAEKAGAGKAVVTKHKDRPSEVDAKLLEQLLGAAREAKCATVAVLVRRRNTKAKLLRAASAGDPPTKCRGVDQIARALDGLLEGRGRRAVDIAHAFMCRILFEDDRPTDEELLNHGVDPVVLRRRVRKLLLNVADAVPGETWAQWAARVKTHCDKLAADCGITTHKQRLGGAFKANADDKPGEVRAAVVVKAPAWPTDLTLEVLTVHEAKGREFDAVAFYCPKPGKAGGKSSCPSETWWLPADDSEEREVAFVAATRAKHVLLLAIHEKTWTSFTGKRPEFLALFESLADPPSATA
ncbi:UvrD-helicase domain-containing protein [Luteitalea sp.]|uniref:UvrD-helicase domain-containing protein n=1 Tax=Luteitalea sp. TaxID=2004800 RepID=UPI0025BFEC28|nr:UvrD-helicase domain-containing protein [Luteitalea sp.]